MFCITGEHSEKLHATKKLSFYGWVKFNLTALAGLSINLVVLNLILYFYDVPYKVIAQFCEVAFGTVFNYLGSKFFVINKSNFRRGNANR
jgi:putative flippase GtrA